MNRLVMIVLVLATSGFCSSRSTLRNDSFKERIIIFADYEMTAGLNGSLEELKASSTYLDRKVVGDKCFILTEWRNSLQHAAEFCDNWALIRIWINHQPPLENIANEGATLHRRTGELGQPMNFFHYGRMNADSTSTSRNTTSDSCNLSHIDLTANKVVSNETLETDDPRCNPTNRLTEWFTTVEKIMQENGFRYGDKRVFPHPDFVKFLDAYEAGQ